MKKRIFPILSIIMALTLVASVSAQVSYTDPVYTSYQIVNLGDVPADITVSYYDGSGNKAAFEQKFYDVVAGGAKTVQQSMESSLGSGTYSAVVSADQPIAAIVNQQLGQANNGSSFAPYSSYSGSKEGSTSVTLPVIMYNWYGYYTELFIQNAGTGTANDVTITYTPTKIGSCTTGATGQSNNIASPDALEQYAGRKVSQVSMTNLGLSGAPAGCTGYNGKFLGSATITSDQPIVVVVNQVVQNKLFTYNGFTTVSTGQKLLVPAYMRNYYGYYASVTIANPGDLDATVTMTYKSDAVYSNPKSKTVVKSHTVKAHQSITIYDGPSSNASQSDLTVDFPYNTDKKFFGTIVIDSNKNVVAMVNQESTKPGGGGQAGSYNAFASTEGSQVISVPLIQSAFYGYYTSLTIMTVDGTQATVKITYTSDGTYSTVKNTSKSYTLTTDANGFLNRYEGPAAKTSQSDLLDDLSWLSGGQRKFLGSALIEVQSGGPNIVAFVNSESQTALYADVRDGMYTYNAFNITP